MKKAFVYLSCLIGCLFVSCQQKQPLDEFTFLYTLEVVNNYKISLSFDSQKKFRKEVANYYMDNMEKVQRPEIEEGILTDEQFETLKKKLEAADIPSMKEAYGFQQKRPQATQDMLMQVVLTQKAKKKYVSIQYDKDLKLPAGFIELLTEINKISVQEAKASESH